jgi:hypothetical protein
MMMMIMIVVVVVVVVARVTLDSAAGGLWAGSTGRGDARQNKQVKAEGGMRVGGCRRLTMTQK